MAADSLNLAETYSLVGSHLDKSDNLHLNGDYHKMLACSHVICKLIRENERTTVLVVVPPRYETIIKKASIPFREKMLAFTCYLPNAYNNTKIKNIFILSMVFFNSTQLIIFFQPLYKLQNSLEILDKGSIIFHNAAQKIPFNRLT